MTDLARIAKWVATTPTGDVAELDFAPTDAVLRGDHVGSDECPGADRCPMGEPCFAELARRRASVADVVVVNTYLYGLARRRPAGRSCPSTTSSCSTRPTGSRTS